VGPELRARAGDALVRAVEHAMRVDPENANEYVAALGQVPEERAHDLLRELVNRRGGGFGQALIVLTWRKSPTDLPKLAQLALEPMKNNALDHEFTSLPYALHNGYGDAAIPYLDTLLERSEFTFVRTNCARELILAKRPEGFAFVADWIANARSYRQEMVEFVLRPIFRGSRIRRCGRFEVRPGPRSRKLKHTSGWVVDLRRRGARRAAPEEILLAAARSISCRAAATAEPSCGVKSVRSVRRNNRVDFTRTISAFVNITSGTFRLTDVPHGHYTLRIMQYQADPPVSFAAEEPITIAATPISRSRSSTFACV
jgi:hypothetical protein